MRIGIFALLIFFPLASVCIAQVSDLRFVKGFTKSVQREFGSMRGMYEGSGGLVSRQVFEAMGHPRPDQPLADGNVLVSGCRPHDCPESSAIIATPDGRFLAAGLINFPCAYNRSVFGVTCDSKYYLDIPVLTIFVKKRNDRPDVERTLKGWADGVQALQQKENPTAGVQDITVVEVKFIPER